MKRLLFIIPLLLYALNAAADENSEAILSRLTQTMTSLGSYNAKFEIEAEGNRVNGEYYVSGNKYFMRTDDFEVVSDGVVKYEINHYDEEVAVDSVNPEDRNILSNPTKAFVFASDLFGSTYKGEQLKNGSVCDVIELVPRDTGGALKRITVKIARNSGLPVELRYLSDGLSDDVVVEIVKLTSGVEVGVVFDFDKKKYKGYEIIDFR